MREWPIGSPMWLHQELENVERAFQAIEDARRRDIWVAMGMNATAVVSGPQNGDSA